MTALTANAAQQTRNDTGKTKYNFVINTGSTIYRHALVVINAAGTAQPAANDTTTSFVGLALDPPVDANGVVAAGDGTRRIEVVNDLEVRLASVTAITVGDTGQTAIFASDDALVTADTTLGAEIGIVTEFVGAEDVWVRLRARTLLQGV